jgi:N-acetylglucosaminyldiphosphoundecaprenol N-acetyl-beta-D-mannosaminyltransferase
VITGIKRFVHDGRKSGQTQHVMIINSDFLASSIHDPELRYLLQNANLVLGDSALHIIAPFIVKNSVECWLPKTISIPHLISLVAKQNYSLYLLGINAEKSTNAVERLREFIPGLDINGSCVPNWGSSLDIDWDIVNTINEASPDILLVDLEAPRQEKWIGIHRNDLNVPVIVGFCGFLDFILGNPMLSQSVVESSKLIKNRWGLDKLRSPDWKRYIQDSLNFLYFIFRSFWRNLRVKTGKPGMTVEALASSEQFTAISTRLRGVTWLILKGPCHLDASAAPELEIAGITALKHNPFLILDLTETTIVTSSGVGALKKLHATAYRHHGAFRIVNTSKDVLRVIHLLGFDNILEVYPNVTVATA